MAKALENMARGGIYDILLSMNDKPFILLELKRPDESITDEDVDQGISYARLTNRAVLL